MSLAEPNVNKQTSFGGISFAFDEESAHPPDYFHSFSTEQSYHEIAGDFQFRQSSKLFYWRKIVPVVLVASILSVAFFSFGKSFKSSLAATLTERSVSKVEKPLIEENVNLAVLEKDIQEEIKELTETVEEQEITTDIIEELNVPPIENKNSVAEIKQEEKTTPTPKTKVQKQIEIAQNTIVETVVEPTTINVSPSTSIYDQKAVPEETVSFKTNSIARARALSAKTGRYVLMKFSADWCITCKLMESTAMKEEQVVALLAEKFVVLTIDVDRGEGPFIKEEFYVDKLPTLIVLDELGNTMKREEKALGTIALIEMLESVEQYIYLKEELTVQKEEVDRVGER